MKRLKFKTVIGILLLLVLAASYGYWQMLPKQQDVIQQIFGNQQNYDAVVSSQKVTAQLLHKQHKSQDEAKLEKLEGYTSDAEIPVSPADIEKIKKILRSPSSYRWNVASSCIPDYGVLLNFHSDQRSVQLAFCFNCDLMGVFSGEETPVKRVSAGTIFTPMRAQLVPMMKTLFPNDRNIQELKLDRD